MRTKIELCKNRVPLCPYCHADYEIEGVMDDDDQMAVQCGKCDKHFAIQGFIRVTYDTMGDCEKNKEMPHELMPKSNDFGPHTCRKCSREVYEWELPHGQYPKLKLGEYVFVERKRTEDFYG